jgi:hypothetical protein
LLKAYRQALFAGKKILWKKAQEESNNLMGKAIDSATKHFTSPVKICGKICNNTESELLLDREHSYIYYGQPVVQPGPNLQMDHGVVFAAERSEWSTAGTSGWYIYYLPNENIEIFVGWMKSKRPRLNPTIISFDLGLKGDFSGLDHDTLFRNYMEGPGTSKPRKEGKWSTTGGACDFINPDGEKIHLDASIEMGEDFQTVTFILDKWIDTPNLLGKSLKEAKEILYEENLVIDEIVEEQNQSVKKGLIFRQEPNAGEHISDGGLVNVFISVGR